MICYTQQVYTHQIVSVGNFLCFFFFLFFEFELVFFTLLLHKRIYNFFFNSFFFRQFLCIRYSNNTWNKQETAKYVCVIMYSGDTEKRDLSYTQSLLDWSQTRYSSNTNNLKYSSLSTLPLVFSGQTRTSCVCVGQCERVHG